MRRGTVLLGVALLTAGLLAGCSDDEGPGPPTVTATPQSDGATSEEPSDPASEDEPNRPPRVVKALATGLAVPWGLDFLPDGRAIVTERDTRRVLLLDPGGGTPTVVGTIDAAAPQGEAGLLGVAVSPDFAGDGLVYLYLTTAEDNRIVRATLRDDRLGTPEVVLAGIPNGFVHDGGRLEFGPDGFLYASTGETGEQDLAQDKDSLGGKILRITPDGDPAPGNPDPGSPVWSWGHRNVQGLAFDDEDRLWASEFGDQTFDELNLIRPDGNYGWPAVEGRGDDDRFVNPQVVWRTDQASPSGLAYDDGRLWLAALRGARLWRIEVVDGRATEPRDFFVGDYGRMRTVEVAPDGRLWVTTSNRDGRGEPGPGDDQVLLIDPGS